MPSSLVSLHFAKVPQAGGTLTFLLSEKGCPGSSRPLLMGSCFQFQILPVSNLRHSKPWRGSTSQVRHKPTALQRFIPKVKSGRIFSSLGLLLGAANLPVWF